MISAKLSISFVICWNVVKQYSSNNNIWKMTISITKVKDFWYNQYYIKMKDYKFIQAVFFIFTKMRDLYYNPCSYFKMKDYWNLCYHRTPLSVDLGCFNNILKCILFLFDAMFHLSYKQKTVMIIFFHWWKFMFLSAGIHICLRKFYFFSFWYYLLCYNHVWSFFDKIHLSLLLKRCFFFCSLIPQVMLIWLKCLLIADVYSIDMFADHMHNSFYRC